MLSKRLALMLVGLSILASVAACAPLPPATQAPVAPEASATTRVDQPVVAPTPAPAATTALPATSLPAASPTSVAGPSPVIPDPKTDPTGALLSASSGQLFKTAEFTYTMGMTMEPADEASAKVLGAQADALEGLVMEAKGEGAMEVTDPSGLKSKLRMDMDISAAGQQMQIQMVVIDQTAWVKLAGQDTWQKVEGEQATSLAPGVSPEKILEDLKNAIDVQWIEDVTLDGEQVSHLRFTMDPATMDLASLTSSTTSKIPLTPEELQAMFKDFKPVVDVWLSKDDLQLRGEKMQLEWVMPLPEMADAEEAKLRVAMTMDMQFSNVNEPVTIQPPVE